LEKVGELVDSLGTELITIHGKVQQLVLEGKAPSTVQRKKPFLLFLSSSLSSSSSLLHLFLT
jgi:hypothetical protein